jgi:hypothetical protein
MAIAYPDWRYLAVAGLTLLNACGGGTAGTTATAVTPVSPAAAVGVALNNLQIAEQLYADSARTPAGFYADPAPSGQLYVSTRHLRNSDLGIAQAAGQELCSDDWNQALSWSEQAANRAAAYANLVATDDNSRYFEFDRVLPGDPQILQRGRVYHCRYLDRSGSDSTSAVGPAGTLNLRPLDAVALRQLSEYLWQFTSYNNSGSAVLTSSGVQQAGTLRHTLVIATLQGNATQSGCERVDVVGWWHSLDLSTGALLRGADVLWSFGARRSSGIVESCVP